MFGTLNNTDNRLHLQVLHICLFNVQLWQGIRTATGIEMGRSGAPDVVQFDCLQC